MSKKLEEHNNFGIDATIIADSVGPEGNRLTTFILTMPRIVLAEFNTHRMLSRNSASSRAIPFKTMVERVKENPFIPLKWQKDHSGMQGTEYLEDTQDIARAEHRWLLARNAAVEQASVLNEGIEITKQLCNRLLEPFLWHTVIATGSEWENFFALRAHPAAEIHIAALAEKMLEEYNSNLKNAKRLKAGEWHIPFGDDINLPGTIPIEEGYTLEEGVQNRKVKIATARCARVSYLNYEGKDDYTADIKLHDRLAQMGHWSPFEHCARVMSNSQYDTHISGIVLPDLDQPDIEDRLSYAEDSFGWSGNFKGFIQYRKMFEEENKSDPRVISCK